MSARPKPKQARQVNRYCRKCGRWYYRCDKVAVWDKRNPGKRAGWHQEQGAYCLACSSLESATSILVIAGTKATRARYLKLVKK
jgi:hypothetical protein